MSSLSDTMHVWPVSNARPIVMHSATSNVCDSVKPAVDGWVWRPAGALVPLCVAERAILPPADRSCTEIARHLAAHQALGRSAVGAAIDLRFVVHV